MSESDPQLQANVRSVDMDGQQPFLSGMDEYMREHLARLRRDSDREGTPGWIHRVSAAPKSTAFEGK